MKATLFAGALSVCLLAAGTARCADAVDDFDGDGKPDLAVYNEADGYWYVLLSTGGAFIGQWGFPGAAPVPGDYDGDKITDLAVFSLADGYWYILLHDGRVRSFQWGFPGVWPVQADFDGDGRTDPAVYDPPTGIWYVLYLDNRWESTQWGFVGPVAGGPTVLPVPGDYDGDGKDDMAVYYRDQMAYAYWYLLLSGGGMKSVNWGSIGSLPSQGDYDGDGATDTVIYKLTWGAWYIPYWPEIFWGIPSRTLPVAGSDRDGDGKDDMTVYDYTDGSWYVFKSGGGTAHIRWGFSNAVPADVVSTVLNVAGFKPWSW